MPGQSGGGGTRANYEKTSLAKFLAATAKQGIALKDERANMRNAASKSSNNSPTKNKVPPGLDPYDRFASNRKSRGKSTGDYANNKIHSYINPKTKIQEGE